MGHPAHEYLSGPKIYACATCHVHLGLPTWVLSKNFTCHTGAAYLFDRVLNLHPIDPTGLGAGVQEKLLRTGVHRVEDVRCRGCDGYLGWYYHSTSGGEQDYKLGKIVLEKSLLVKLSEPEDGENASDRINSDPPSLAHGSLA